MTESLRISSHLFLLGKNLPSSILSIASIYAQNLEFILCLLLLPIQNDKTCILICVKSLSVEVMSTFKLPMLEPVALCILLKFTIQNL